MSALKKKKMFPAFAIYVFLEIADLLCSHSQTVVRLSPLGTAATSGLLYQPQMTDGDCGAIGGMKIGRGN
jgi:hypothetical protein